MNKRNQKGITLIALIITIIVMLILVAVVVRTAINSGLFGHAKNATEKWGDAQRKEGEIGNGKITIDGTEYDSIDDYLESNKNEPSLTAKVTVKNDKVFHLGEVIEYELVIKNNGNAPVKNIQISASEADTTIEQIPADETLEVGKSKTIQCSYINMQDRKKTGILNGEADFTNKFTITGDAIISQEDSNIKNISTEKSVTSKVDTETIKVTFIPGEEALKNLTVGDKLEQTIKIQNLTNFIIQHPKFVVDMDRIYQFDIDSITFSRDGIEISETHEAEEEWGPQIIFALNNIEAVEEIEIKITFELIEPQFGGEVISCYMDDYEIYELNNN